MTSTVAIVTDSACDLPLNIAEKHAIGVVPLTIRFDDEEFVDRIELNSKDFWRRSEASSILPSTAAPSPGAFEQAFRQARAAGAASVVCICISSALSATFQAAVAGAKNVVDDIDVRVIDSKQCTVGQGLLCIEAAKSASEGASVEDVLALVEDLKSRLGLLGTLDTLDNLRKGGRIGAAGAFFGSLLSVKPLIEIKDGSVNALSKQRTRSRAMEHLTRLVRDQAPLDLVAVAHAQAPDIDRFLQLLSPVAPVDSLLVTDIGPVIGTHGGLRTVAVAYVKSKDVSS